MTRRRRCCYNCYGKSGFLIGLILIGIYLIALIYDWSQELLPQKHFKHIQSFKDDKVQHTSQATEEAFKLNAPKTPQKHPKTNWFTSFKKQAFQWYNEVFQSNRLAEFRQWAINRQRMSIKSELQEYNTSLIGKKWEELVMENGGKPIINVVFTTWRSGSTFIGEILNSHPGTFYHYEPLIPLEIVQVRSGDLAEKAINIIQQVLNCNFTSEYIKYGEDHFEFHSHNSRMSQYCEMDQSVCFNAKFISSMCQLFPFHALKTVRMRLRLAKILLEDSKRDIRLLYIVRDPRGTMQSRRHRDWCPDVPDCSNPSILCQDLEDDFYAAQILKRIFPSKIIIFRYEDFSLNIFEAVKRLFHFFRLEYNYEVEDFLKNHTMENEGGLYSTKRNSKTAPFHWVTDYANNFNEIGDIQQQCQGAMSLWGYNLAHNLTHMLSFNSLGKPPWDHMTLQLH